jgi:hypothetical protein
MNKPWEALLATSAVVSLALGGVVVASASASAADLPVSSATEAPVDPTAPGEATAPVGDVPVEPAVPAEPAVPTDDPAVVPEPAAPAAPVDEPAVALAPDAGDDAPTVDAVEPDAAADDVVAAALAPAPAAPALDDSRIALFEVSTAEGATETDVPLTFTGTGLVGAVVTVDFSPVGDGGGVAEADQSVVVDAGGRWSVDVRVVPGNWTYRATQHTVGTDGVATSEESAPSAERSIVVTAKVLPQWGVVDMEGDETWAANSVSAKGVDFAEVFVSGSTGTLYNAEIRLLSADRSTTWEVLRPDEYADGRWTHAFALVPGEYRIAIRQIDADTPGTFPRYTSDFNYSPVIRVVPVDQAGSAAPAVSSPTDGGVVVVPAGRDATPITLQGTAAPGYRIIASASRGRAEERQDYVTFVGAGPDGAVIADAEGRWTASTRDLRPGRYVITVEQYDPRLQNPLTSDVTTLTVEVRAATAVTPAGTTVRPTAGGSLAYTGSDDASQALVGGGLAVVLGALGLVVARVRRRAVAESDVTTRS